MTVYYNIILNFKPYLDTNPVPLANDPVDTFIRSTANLQDITRRVGADPAITSDVIECLAERYYGGMLSQPTQRCALSGVFTALLFLTMGLIMVYLVY